MDGVITQDFIRLNFPASYRYLSIIGPCLSIILEGVNAPIATDLPGALELAIHETCVNIVQHAYRGEHGSIQLEISIASDPLRLVVDLYDTGQSFDLSEVSEPPLDEPQVRGYGLFLIRQLMDDVRYHANTERNHWQLIKYL